jgi:hypothetical protein
MRNGCRQVAKVDSALVFTQPESGERSTGDKPSHHFLGER